MHQDLGKSLPTPDKNARFRKRAFCLRVTRRPMMLEAPGPPFIQIRVKATLNRRPSIRGVPIAIIREDGLHLLSHLKNPQWRDIHHRPRCMMILQYLGNEDIHGILQHIIHTFMRCNFGFSTILGFSITI